MKKKAKIPQIPMKLPSSAYSIDYGFHELEKVIFGFVGGEHGIILAFRSNGDEALWFPKDMAPARWIKVSEFIPDSKSFFTPDEFRDRLKHGDLPPPGFAGGGEA